jgi:hypothetical protein
MQDHEYGDGDDDTGQEIFQEFFHESDPHGCSEWNQNSAEENRENDDQGDKDQWWVEKVSR